MEHIVKDKSQISKLVEFLNRAQVPPEQETTTHSFVSAGDSLHLANSYFAIVAICHQTSPLGERQLEGYINGVRKVGWDYLKEKFLVKALEDSKWASPDYWIRLKPVELSELYEDGELGKTLNRVNERTFLLNNLGHRLKESGNNEISEAFNNCHGIIGSGSGFLNFLKSFEAYKDPVRKKSLFFLSIMMTELGWVIQDKKNLFSPIDYHEMRGHIRIGTIEIKDMGLASKVEQGLVLTEDEDFYIRSKILEVNNEIGVRTGLTSSIVHYLFWNVFRNCCPRESNNTHCSGCGENCTLPIQYKNMSEYKQKCLFTEFCNSANMEIKITDPPYIGHYY